MENGKLFFSSLPAFQLSSLLVALLPPWQYLLSYFFMPWKIRFLHFQLSIVNFQLFWQLPGTLIESSHPPNVNYRVISTTRLCRRRLYTCGLSTSSSTTTLKGDLILRQASRLDAFSAYPVRAWLPGRTTGVITGSLAARPTRSSRTRVRTSRISNAHDR